MNLNPFSSRRRALIRCRVPDLDEWTEPRHRRADAVAMATAGRRLDLLDQLIGTPRLRFARWLVDEGRLSDQTAEPRGRDEEGA